jgi:hypothetical protein
MPQRRLVQSPVRPPLPPPYAAPTRTPTATNITTKPHGRPHQPHLQQVLHTLPRLLRHQHLAAVSRVGQRARQRHRGAPVVGSRGCAGCGRGTDPRGMDKSAIVRGIRAGGGEESMRIHLASLGGEPRQPAGGNVTMPDRVMFPDGLGKKRLVAGGARARGNQSPPALLRTPQYKAGHIIIPRSGEVRRGRDRRLTPAPAVGWYDAIGMMS